MKKTIKDILDEAYSNAWDVLLKTLNDNNVKYDNNTGTVFVDDTEDKITYYLDVVLEESDEYYGDDEDDE